MFVVVTKENKLIRGFENGKVTCYDDRREAETLAQIVGGKVYLLTEEEIKIANRKRK